jgi:hypothetical protein
MFLVDHNVWGVVDSAGAVRQRAWRNAAGTWSIGSHAQWRAIKDNLPAPQRVNRIQLPLLPVLPHPEMHPADSEKHSLHLGRQFRSKTGTNRKHRQKHPSQFRLSIDIACRYSVPRGPRAHSRNVQDSCT